MPVMEVRNGSLQARSINSSKSFHKSSKGSSSFFGLPRSFDELIGSITFSKRKYTPHNSFSIYRITTLFSRHHWENNTIVRFSFPKQFDIFDDTVGGFKHIAVNSLKDIVSNICFHQIGAVDVPITIRFYRKDVPF